MKLVKLRLTPVNNTFTFRPFRTLRGTVRQVVFCFIHGMFLCFCGVCFIVLCCVGLVDWDAFGEDVIGFHVFHLFLSFTCTCMCEDFWMKAC